MARGLEFPFIANVARWLSGTRDVEQSLDKVGDSLDDLYRDTARGSDTAADRLEDSFKDAFSEVRRSAQKAGDDIADPIRKGAEGASDGVRDLKRNAEQNAKEMGASFQDVASAIDGLQGYLSEALEGFGPAGVAAGVGMAAGLGIAQQALQRAADHANELKEQAGELAIAWRDATTAEQVQAVGEQWDELTQKIVDAKSWWEIWQSDARNVADVLSAALAADAPRVKAFMDAFNLTDPLDRQRALAAALADTTDEAHRLDTQVADLEAKQRRAAAASTNQTQATEKWTAADSLALQQAKQHRIALDDLIPTMKEQADQADATARQIEALARVEGLTVDQYKAQVIRAQEAAAAYDERRQANEAYASSVAAMAGVQDVYSAAAQRNTEAIQAWADQHKTSFEKAEKAWSDAPLTLDEVLDELSRRVQARRDFEASLDALATRGFGALADELRRQGPEAAAATAALLAAGTDSQVQRFATDQGYMLGKQLVQGTGDAVRGMGYLIDQALGDAARAAGPLTVPVQLDTKDAERTLKNWRPTVTVVARPGQPAVN